MNGPFAGEYWKTAEKDIKTLEGLCVWDVFKRGCDMNVIDGTWAFNYKQFPNGTVKKFKACLCTPEDQHLEGIDFFETCVPVVKQTTVYQMMLFGLKPNKLISPLPFFMLLAEKMRKSM
ncbi:hypothetical protein ACHAXS_003039 [Conticribra weissflogii]